MASRRVTDNPEPRRTRPATTPEARENELIALAVDLAERQLRDGTASSQVQTHFLKLASSREKLEQERIRGEININKAKQEILASEKRTEALYEKALKAMRSYGGYSEPEEENPDAY